MILICYLVIKRKIQNLSFVWTNFHPILRHIMADCTKLKWVKCKLVCFYVYLIIAVSPADIWESWNGERPSIRKPVRKKVIKVSVSLPAIGQIVSCHHFLAPVIQEYVYGTKLRSDWYTGTKSYDDADKKFLYRSHIYNQHDNKQNCLGHRPSYAYALGRGCPKIVTDGMSEKHKL